MDTKNIAYVMFKSKSYNISMVSKEHKTCTIKKTKHLMELSVSLAIWEFHCLILYIKNQNHAKNGGINYQSNYLYIAIIRKLECNYQ